MRYIHKLLLCTICIIPFALHAEAPYKSEILKQTRHYVITGNKLIQTDSMLIQINNRSASDDATITLPYTKGDKVSVILAQIEDSRGNIIRKLKNNEIKHQSAISDIALYEDDFIKFFELNHNMYPYRIRYVTQTTRARFLQVCMFDPRYNTRPIHQGRIIVEAPKDFPIKYKQSNMPQPGVSSNPQSTVYCWNYSFYPAKTREKDTDYNEDKLPLLTILPENYNYGKKGSWENWESFGNWIYRLNEGRDILPANEKDKIRMLLAGATDSTEKAKILYRFLQENTRYVNIKIQVGGLQTYPASYVCVNKYGDCKALTNYMQALLKEAGIESYYTLIYSDTYIQDIDPAFPSQEFNHVILTIPFGQDTTYLECTSKNTPFGYIHSGIQGRKALLVKEKGSELISLPALQANDVTCLRNIKVRGNSVALHTIQRGPDYELVNFLMTGINKNKVDIYLRNTIFSNGTYSLTDYTFEKKDDVKPEINLHANINMQNLSKQYGESTILTPFPFNLPVYENPDNRESGVKLNYPIHYIDSITYLIDGKTLVKAPDNINIENEFGHYYAKFDISGNEIKVTKSVYLKSGHYPLSQYTDFYNFIQQVSKSDNKNIYIETL